jgi:hypothetical protein
LWLKAIRKCLDSSKTSAIGAALPRGISLANEESALAMGGSNQMIFPITAPFLSALYAIECSLLDAERGIARMTPPAAPRPSTIMSLETSERSNTGSISAGSSEVVHHPCSLRSSRCRRASHRSWP